jgi:hypothetical protein
MGFVPLATWLGLAVGVRALFSKPAVSFRTIAAAGAVLVLVWSPVAWDALAHNGGNPAKLVRRFGVPYQRHPLSEVIGTIDTLAAESLGAEPWVRRTLLGASLGLLILAALRRGPRTGSFRWILLLLAGSWATFVWSVCAIPEPIQTYYLRPVCVLIAVTLIGGSAALVSLPRRILLRRALAVLIAVLVLGVSAGPALEMRRRFSDIHWNSYPLAEMRVVVQVIVSRSGPAVSRPVRVDLRIGDLAGAEGSFEYLLHREGIERANSPGPPAFRLTLASTVPPPAEETWVEVTKTEKYRLEERVPAISAVKGPVT